MTRKKEGVMAKARRRNRGVNDIFAYLCLKAGTPWESLKTERKPFKVEEE